MIRGEAADHLVTLRFALRQVVLPRQLYCRLNRLGTARGVEDALEPLAELRGEARRQVVGGLVLELCSVGEGDLPGLLCHRVQHPRVALADRRRHGSRATVQVTFAVGVPQPDTLGAVHGGKLEMILVEE